MIRVRADMEKLSGLGSAGRMAPADHAATFPPDPELADREREREKLSTCLMSTDLEIRR